MIAIHGAQDIACVTVGGGLPGGDAANGGNAVVAVVFITDGALPGGIVNPDDAITVVVFELQQAGLAIFVDGFEPVEDIIMKCFAMDDIGAVFTHDAGQLVGGVIVKLKLLYRRVRGQH